MFTTNTMLDKYHLQMQEQEQKATHTTTPQFTVGPLQYLPTSTIKTTYPFRHAVFVRNVKERPSPLPDI